MRIVNILIIAKKILYVANVGDTRSIIVNENDVERISYDHKGSDIRE